MTSGKEYNKAKIRFDPTGVSIHIRQYIVLFYIFIIMIHYYHIKDRQKVELLYIIK